MSDKPVKIVFETKEDLTPAVKIPPAEIDLGGKTYLAYAPNSYDLLELVPLSQKLKQDPHKLLGTFSVSSIVIPFFTRADTAEIIDRCRGADAEIDLMKELLPAIGALTAHFSSLIMDQESEESGAPKSG